RRVYGRLQARLFSSHCGSSFLITIFQSKGVNILGNLALHCPCFHSILIEKQRRRGQTVGERIANLTLN
ncbi:hypothetical protein, partial [Vibrio campbellii]|uniref:hypothetical protein n=1 Tax=Vibrio campbellii TaxID=680 RepID=UPI001BDA05FD